MRAFLEGNAGVGTAGDTASDAEARRRLRDMSRELVAPFRRV